MKHRKTNILKFILILTATTFLYSCHNVDDENVLSADVKEDGTVLAVAKSPEPTANTQIEPSEPIADASSHAPAAVAPYGEDQWAYWADVFSDDLQVDPWRANYVGSYSMLPTRFQDKGPFLYSFDVSPKNAADPDNNIGPMHEWDFFHGDDDDF